jgi:hypothetical protein
MDSDDAKSGPAEADERRRAALKKIGLFGAYTAPAMLAMLKSGKALAASHGGCCWTKALLESGGRVGDARVGDRLLMMHPDGSGTFEGSVQVSKPLEQPCLRMETVGGIALTCSYSTPVPVQRDDDIAYIDARDCLEGDIVPVLDDAGFRWEPLRGLEQAGRLPVQGITANDGIYGAGDEPGRLIFTHNKSGQ